MTADIAILSPQTTLGWRQSDAALRRGLERAGVTVQLLPVRVGPGARLRRNMLLTDVVEAIGASVSARDVDARALIVSSITAALLHRARCPYAVRFDTLAVASRPGVQGAWQRRREPAVLAGARMLLPFSEPAERSARAVLERAGFAVPPIVRLPMAIEEIAPVEIPSLDAAAYGGNPEKRGVELLCQAWAAAAPAGARLVIGGLDEARAGRFLRRAGVAEPRGVEWAGALPRAEWLSIVASARVFVNASRFEDWGIAQLEALAAGVPLVTVPTPGPNEALGLARQLDPDLVAGELSPAALAAALKAGLAYDEAKRAAYRGRALELLAPYRPDAVLVTLREQVLPVLLG